MPAPGVDGDRRPGDRLVVRIDDPPADGLAGPEAELDRLAVLADGQFLETGRMTLGLGGQDQARPAGCLGT